MDRETLNDRLNNRRGVFGYTPLHEAVSGNKSKVIPHLTVEGANVNARANSGYTPLHLAASAGHIDCVKVLLESGADISLTDDYGKTPKQTAGLSSKSNIVRLLRSEGEFGLISIIHVHKSTILLQNKLWTHGNLAVYCK